MCFIHVEHHWCVHFKGKRQKWAIFFHDEQYVEWLNKWNKKKEVCVQWYLCFSVTQNIRNDKSLITQGIFWGSLKSFFGHAIIMITFISWRKLGCYHPSFIVPLFGWIHSKEFHGKSHLGIDWFALSHICQQQLRHFSHILIGSRSLHIPKCIGSCLGQLVLHWKGGQCSNC